MSNIDDLFKSANGAPKRKYTNPNEADPTQAFKSVKLSSNTDVKHSATLTDEDEDMDEAGPSLPPDFDDEPGDDDEGRFFEGGMDDDAKDAMDYLDAQDGDDVIKEEVYDSAWLRKLCLNFEKRVNKNASLRAKYESDPAKFMESEGELDEANSGLRI